MASKTFKLGEYAKGGVITANVTKTKVTIIGKEWDTSAGYSKSSSQTNAKEFTRLEVSTDDRDAERKLDFFLCDLTSSYYADQVMDYVRKNTTLHKRSMW
jgi:hypothetical protein